LRSLAFAHAARELGIHVDVFETIERAGADFWQRDGLQDAAKFLVNRFSELENHPTGLFVAEDRLVPAIDTAMNSLAQSSGGPGASVDVISCNNETSQFVGMKRPPATIDIRAESIGRLGVERLIWRVANPELQERIRCMVEPTLVQPMFKVA
jgi:DNA-binding LacI/PurR family transcriptional regulator